MRGASPRDRLRRIIPPGPIGWAAFLACSWTWCIGMFLPVLMLRDYGAWGWWVFAVPNVLGAAAMGWLLRDPAASRSVQQNHPAACRAFSWVTLAFHAYFIVALMPRVVGDGVVALTAALVPVVLLLRGRAGRRDTIAAAVIFSISVLALLGVLALEGMPRMPSHAKNRTDLLWLAPVCLFGFLLDPYLDLTFHRARQMTTRAGGRTAFGLGFGVFFMTMLAFTAVYALPVLVPLAVGRPLDPKGDPFAAVLSVHVALQTAFTVVAHAHSLRATRPADAPVWTFAGGAAAVLAVALLLRWVQQRVAVYRGVFGGDGLGTYEVIYRAFMAFYGLVFPAYAWLFMVPRRLRGGGRAPGIAPTTGRAVYFAAVVLLAAPAFWLAFIEGRMVWLGPGLGLVLLARFLLPKPAVPAPAA